MAAPTVPGIELEYVFSITMVECSDPVGPSRDERWALPASGIVYGPLLNGKVFSRAGADLAVSKNRSQGVKTNTHQMLQTDDGVWIYVNNRGYVNHSPDPSRPGHTRLYFRITPIFESPPGPYEWLSRTMIVGTGESLIDLGGFQFTYYRVK